MTAEIRRLIDEVYRVNLKEQEAEIMLLQSQINPHFLYNTLETISMMAVERGTLDVSDTVVKLGKMLRYSSASSAPAGAFFVGALVGRGLPGHPIAQARRAAFADGVGGPGFRRLPPAQVEPAALRGERRGPRPRRTAGAGGDREPSPREALSPYSWKTTGKACRKGRPPNSRRGYGGPRTERR